MARQLKGVSIRECARQLGVSDTAIHKAMKAGRCTRHDDGSVDVEAVRLGMALTADPTRGGARHAGVYGGPQAGTTVVASEFLQPPAANIPAGAGGGSSDQALLLKARREREQNAAIREALETQREQQLLAEVAPMARAVFDAMADVHSALRALPDRLTPLLTPETDPAKVYSLIEEEVNRIALGLRDTLAQRAATGVTA